ncbi:MAG: Asp-tRNA(Asn)/Glu-tRNA(Gln) amidotransferase subunit GatB [Nanoarchaeota archaeon]|nr:Asp-tRNA(Asn)/Glu-tRNA(Gln) amidotransferase subunit GatB [Nanoarchaeota archaeon]
MEKIGLEIHGYLVTKEKLFCCCRAIRHSKKENIKPNTNICPICTGQPGAKPMLPNSEAINNIIRIALMLGCDINTKEKNKILVWNRKHYDWPDLPKGYQNTISGAYSVPVAENGKFEGIRIREIHLEEDPASWNPETGCIDYNRSGLPLVEIVTEPDFKNSEQVVNWIKSLLLILSYIKAVDKNAGIKADVNVSVSGGERVEIKNMSSLVSIKNAIEYEIRRQKKEGAERETRRFDEKKQQTIKMRTKEQAEDYRFIPDPDLPVIKLTNKETDELRKQLPETPKQKLDKLVKQHKLDKKNAEVLYKNFELVEFFEKVAEKIKADFAIYWITIELLRVLNYAKKTLNEVNINAEHFIELLEAVKLGKITELKAKQILNDFIPSSFSIKNKLKKESKIINGSEIEKFCEQAIKKNSKAVSDYRAGEEKSINFLIGDVMRLSSRRADFKVVRKILEKLLK